MREINNINLHGQTLEVPLDLRDARVVGSIDLTGATLKRGLIAEDTLFEKAVILRRSRIFGDVFAKGAQFAADVDFSWSLCKGRLYFWRARFNGSANFFQLQCSPDDRPGESFVHPGELNFSWAWFHGPVTFGRCHINGPAYFWRTRFFNRCSFEEASFGNNAVFMGAKSEICLDRNELPAGVFDRLEAAGLLRPDPEEVWEFEGRTFSRFAQLRDITSEQQLAERIREVGLSDTDAEVVRNEYSRHSGPMFGAEAILSRIRIPQPKSVRFIGVNAGEWALEGTNVDAIDFFDAAQKPVPAAIGLGRRYHSVFISYGGPDIGYARRLDQALSQVGVETYLFPEDAVPGNRIENEMREGVGGHERTLLLCSRNGIGRPGWLFEAREALNLEKREGGVRLIPITLDEGLWEWRVKDLDQEKLKRTMLERATADFRNAHDDEVAYNNALAKLLKALTRPNPAA